MTHEPRSMWSIINLLVGHSSSNVHNGHVP